MERAARIAPKYAAGMKAMLFAVLAGLCWGIGEVFTKMVLHSDRVGPVTALAVRSTIALPIIWLVYLVVVNGLKLEPTDWTRAGPGVLWKLVLGSGVLAGAGGALFFYAALNFGEVSRVKPIAFALAPAVAVIIGWTLLGDGFSLKRAVGVAAILIGVVLLGTSAAPSKGKPEGGGEPGVIRTP